MSQVHDATTSPERTQGPSAIVRELAAVYLAAAALTVVTGYGQGALARDFGHLALAGGFLWLSLHMARRTGRSARDYGIDLEGVLEARRDASGAPEGLWSALHKALPRMAKELLFALLCAAIIFPPFVVGFKLWHDVTRPFSLHLPDAPLDAVLTQLLVVALPEEALFRGYFQTRLRDLFPARRSVLGARISPAAIAWQAALFALLHFVVGFSPSRLAVFFPGLVFGFIRAKRDGIGAAMWFHAMSNLLSITLSRGYM